MTIDEDRPVPTQARPAFRIADVARIAGVSPATVSRTLANPDKVTPETRERVLTAVRLTGYTPNVAGRNLRARRSMMALVVVPNIGNPFFSEVLRGIDETLSEEGYGLIIGNLDQTAAKESRFVDVVFAGQVDGVILLNGHLLQGRGRSLAEAPVPVVAACEVIPGAEIPQVEVQNREAARAVAAYLLGLGHRRFGYIAGPDGNILEVERSAGFLATLAEAGIPAGAVATFAGDFSFRSGAEAAGRYLATEPRATAVFAANDEMAIGFMKTVAAAGLKVPDDVTVVGFDAIDFADYCEPRLTTVVQPRRQIGQAAARLLIDGIAGLTEAPGLVRMEASLLMRDSSGPPRR
jgi:LacI family repressor for deo operon, udp, cdd, tsx, nupC, and nupG